MKTVSQNTPTIYSATTPENNPPQLVASLVPDEQRISFWPQHFGLIPQWVTLEPRVFGWMDRLCEDYCGGIWNLYTLNNGGAFMAPEPDDDDDETWVLFNVMNGIRFCGLNDWACPERSVVWLSFSSAVMASVSFIWMPALNACRGYPLSTGNQAQHEIINHGNRTGYSDCVAAGQYRLRIRNYLRQR